MNEGQVFLLHHYLAWLSDGKPIFENGLSHLGSYTTNSEALAILLRSLGFLAVPSSFSNSAGKCFETFKHAIFFFFWHCMTSLVFSKVILFLCYSTSAVARLFAFPTVLQVIDLLVEEHLGLYEC